MVVVVGVAFFLSEDVVVGCSGVSISMALPEDDSVVLGGSTSMGCSWEVESDCCSCCCCCCSKAAKRAIRRARMSSSVRGVGDG